MSCSMFSFFLHLHHDPLFIFNLFLCLWLCIVPVLAAVPLYQNSRDTMAIKAAPIYEWRQSVSTRKVTDWNHLWIFTSISPVTLFWSSLLLLFCYYLFFSFVLDSSVSYATIMLVACHPATCPFSPIVLISQLNLFTFFSSFKFLSKARGNKKSILSWNFIYFQAVPFISSQSLSLLLRLSLFQLLWELCRQPSSLEKMSHQSWQDGPFALPCGSVSRPSFLSTGTICARVPVPTHFNSLVPFVRLLCLLVISLELQRVLHALPVHL